MCPICVSDFRAVVDMPHAASDQNGVRMITMWRDASLRHTLMRDTTLRDGQSF